jgi:hypothetical protein
LVYSIALDYWQKAWASTKNATDANGLMVADFTLAYWTELLSSLGRLDELNQLISTVNGRALSNPKFQKQFNLAQEAAVVMKHEPGDSYRCGTLALYHVARALNIKTNYSGLTKINSPATGFSLSQLTDLSERYQLGLIAVKRPAGKPLVQRA